MFNFLKRKRSPIKYATFTNPFSSQLGSDSTSFAAIDLICNSFATLSFDFYNHYDRSKTEHNLKELLNNPNQDDTHFSFFYHSAKDYFTNGNVFWYMFDYDGEITSLFRINPNDVRVQRDSVTNEKVFYYNGTVYNGHKILHIPSRFGFNGLIGQPIFDACREVFSTANSLDVFSKTVFQNSVGKRLVIDVGNNEYTQEQIDFLRDDFILKNATLKNSGRPLIAKKGMGYSNVDSGSDNKALQLTENRNFQEHEIAKLLGVPIQLLHGMEGKDIESTYCLFLENAVKPIATSFEQAINKFLLSPRENIYFEFNYNSLLKTNLQTRIDTYSKQFMNGILSINEIREKENRPKCKERAGDSLFIQSNLLPLRDQQLDAMMSSSMLKLYELQEKQESHSKEFHEENPSELGDDKL